MRTTIAIAAAVLMGLAPVAQAAYTTPASKTNVDFQPSRYEFGDTFAKAREALSHNGYNPPIGKYQTSASYNPSIGYASFHAVIMNNNPGVWLHASHGVGGYLGLDAFPDDSTGWVAAADRAASLQSYYSVPSSDLVVFHVPGWAWVIGITAAAIDQYRNEGTTNEIYVFASACDSYNSRGGWWAKAFAGYNYQCPDNVAHSDADAVWGRMDGSNGRTGRSLGSAASGTTLTIAPSGSPLVLAPAVESFTYAAFAVDGTITFDTEMDDLTDAFGLLTAGGTVGIPYASWNGNTQITYGAYCDYDGTGSVTLNTTSATSAGGISINPDGVGTRTETYTVGYSCEGGLNPAAALDDFVVTREGATNRIRWTTDWERGTLGWTVQRVTDGTVSASIPVAPLGGSTAASYDVTDPTGSPTDLYRLVEHQTGGRRDLTYGPQSVRPAFTPVTSEPVTYDPAEVQTILASIPEPATEGPASTGMYYLAIVCPDSFVTTAEQHKNLWISRGVSATVVLLSTAIAQGGIKQTLATMYGVATRAVILVGDASDNVEFDDPANWPDTNWVKPDWPPQPELDLIPTFYVRESAASPVASMSWFTRYFSTDVPYADVDNDGLPDLILGRIPVHSDTEYQAYVAKLTTHLNTPPTASHANKASLFVYAVDFGTVPGDPLGAQADALATHFPATVTLSKMIDRNGPPTTWTTTQLDSIYKAHFNAGLALHDIMSTNASRTNYAFTSVEWGFSMSQLTANNMFPVIAGMSCGMGDFDRRENPAKGRPMCERLLLEPNKGAIAIAGPSRGTYQLGNVEMNRRFIDALYTLNAKNIGTAFLETQRAVIAQYPHFANLARSYGILGDPLVAPIGAPAITAVGDAPAASRIGLAPPSPNPFNPATSLTVHLATRSPAHLAIYDVHGRRVRTLADKILPAGPTTLRWNGTDDAGHPIASGVYFARLIAPAVSRTVKLVLLK